ncbi:MAG: sialidase family protein [Planctomycetota bacterium]|jgi:hypothetical protein
MVTSELQKQALNAIPVSSDIKEKHKTAARGFQGIPGVAVTPSGRLWATWYSGGKGECPENFCLLVSSTDGGKTWSEPAAVIDPPGNVRAYDPTLWIDPLGRMWFFWAQCYSKEQSNIFDGVAGVWGACTEDPESEMPAWSESIRMANGVMMNKPIVLADGQWALPTALWKDLGKGEVPKDLLDERLASITISDNKGKTFSWRGGVDAPERCYDEHMIVELNDGRLWMLIRTSYGIAESFSDDNGATWSAAEDSKLGGPNSRFFIYRLGSGNLILVNHDTKNSPNTKEKPRTRDMLTAWLSKDDGKTWEGGLLLDERVGVSYPDGMEDEDGNIYIIYDRERYKEGEILLACFREEEVMAGEISCAGSFRKQVINKTGGVKDGI